MKFECGQNLALLEWHEWFAWHPVSVADDDCRWLERVMRKCEMVREGYDLERRWRYRAIPHGKDSFGYTARKETIVAAAIQGPAGRIVSLPEPHRHHHLIKLMVDEGYTPPIAYPQGFLTSFGRFVDRRKAYIIAFSAGQKFLRGVNAHGGSDLYSEDLW